MHGKAQSQGTIRRRCHAGCRRTWLSALLPLPLLVLAAVAGSGGGAAHGAEPVQVAVLALEAVGTEAAGAIAVTERLREQLVKTGAFTVVERSRMDGILAEQAFQQAACSGEDCAVTVGKLLGVRKIVVGRLVLLEPQRWLVSLSLVDVETARTDRAESMRHAGALSTMFGGQLANLARRLAGLPPLAVAGPRPTLPGPAAPTTTQPRPLALLPARFSGAKSNLLERDHYQVMARLQRLAARKDTAVALAYSYYPTKPRDAFQAFFDSGLYGESERYAWSGEPARPDWDYVADAAADLDVALVLLYRCRLDADNAGACTVYLYDRASNRTREERIRFAKRQWARELAGAVRALVKDGRSTPSRPSRRERRRPQQSIAAAPGVLDYLPWKRGFSLATKARTPSRKSAVSKQAKLSSYSSAVSGTGSARRRAKALCQRFTSGAPSAMRRAAA